MYKIKSLFLYFTLLWFCFVTNTVNGETITLRIPGGSQSDKIRNPYVDDLLHLIFKKQGITLKVEYNQHYMSLGRSLKELANGNLIDLNWSVTSIDKEHQLLPVKIPVYQGLVGWRVFFIHQNNTVKFAQIKRISDLHPYLAIQRFDWPDYEILQANGLNVEGNIPYDNMHKAVVTGLADYFPRSVLEVIREKDRHNGLTELMIEPNILIKYPSAVYFFVNKSNQELANQIEKGFEKSIADGSFAKLFNQYFGTALEELNLDKRRVFVLENPLMPN